MPSYKYDGDVPRTFPTLGITAEKGDTFEGPVGLKAPGLSSASSAPKAAPAAPVPSAPTTPETIKPSASSDTTAGA